MNKFSPVLDLIKNTPTNQVVFDLKNISWTNSEPRKYLDFLIEKFGFPNSLSPQSGGSAIWYGNRLKLSPFTKIELVDEKILNQTPIRCISFCHAFIRYEIENENFNPSLINKCLVYDHQTQLLRARGPDLSFCTQILLIACYVAQGNLSLKDIEMYQISQDPKEIEEMEAKLKTISKKMQIIQSNFEKTE